MIESLWVKVRGENSKGIVGIGQRLPNQQKEVNEAFFKLTEVPNRRFSWGTLITIKGKHSNAKTVQQSLGVWYM